MRNSFFITPIFVFLFLQIFINFGHGGSLDGPLPGCVSEFLLTVLGEIKQERSALQLKLEVEVHNTIRLETELSDAKWALRQCEIRNERFQESNKTSDAVEQITVKPGATTPRSMAAPETKDLITCEGGTMSFDCTVGKVIRIVDGNYGRTAGRDVCPHSNIQTTSCYAQNSKALLQSRCDGKATCAIPASNAVFGDPCLNTYKYLKVQYSCVSKPM